MNLSTEASIETLPEYANGTNEVDTNVINDQTIASYCSDTVREINSLTEELQQCDLSEIGVPLRYNHENHHSFNIGNGFNDDTLPDANHSVPYGVHKQSVHSPFEENLQSAAAAPQAANVQNNSINDHNNLMASLYNHSVLNGKSNETANCDDVDSSLCYTHFNAHLESHRDENDQAKSRIVMNRSHHSADDTYAHANGRKSSDATTNSDYRVAMCMLQSVDLRGNLKQSQILTTSTHCRTPFSDTSPISSSPLNAQASWHGNVETSTDTLVPVDDRINCEYSTTKVNESAAHENGIDVSAGGGADTSRSLHQPHHPQLMADISCMKSKPLPTCGMQSAMDESIFIQPEQQRMEICNGNRSDAHQVHTASVPNGTANVSSVQVNRRRRNSFNAKPPPYVGDVIATATSHTRPDSISPNTLNSTKFFQQNATRSLHAAAAQPTTIMRTHHTQSQQAPANLSVIPCPDGLAHAISEQNLRLQQIVHDHKVSPRAQRKVCDSRKLRKQHFLIQSFRVAKKRYKRNCKHYD